MIEVLEAGAAQSLEPNQRPPMNQKQWRTELARRIYTPPDNQNLARHEILLRFFNEFSKFNAAFRISVIARGPVDIHRFFHILFALFVSLSEHIAALRVFVVAG